MAATVLVTGNTIFVLFGKADVQPWNTYWETDDLAAAVDKEAEEEEDQKSAHAT